MAGAFLQHLWDAHQIGDLAERQAFPASAIQQTIGTAISARSRRSPEAEAVSTSHVVGMRLLLLTDCSHNSDCVCKQPLHHLPGRRFKSVGGVCLRVAEMTGSI